LADSPSLWELRRRSLVRARKRRREGDVEGLHDFRVALRRTAATAGALGRRKVEHRAVAIVRSLSSDRQSEVDRALLARIRALGLLSEDAATALEIRWKPPIAGTRTDRIANGKEEKFRRLTRKLRRLAARSRTEEVPRLLAKRSEAEAALAKPPARDDDRSLHRYRIQVKRARYLAEDLVASGRPEFEASVARERAAQDVLGRWNDLRLFLARIDRERTKAERRGAVRLASELEDLSKALEEPLAGLRREASTTARRLSASITSEARARSA
jgi:CHAD domain-containing protein